MKKTLSTHPFILSSLVFVVLLSVVIGSLFIRSQIVFGFDQARDGFEAYSIWHNHNIKIQGPSSDIPGVTHGVLWYYILALPYFLSNGNPQFAAFFLFAFSLLTVPLCGLLAQKIFNNSIISYVSMVLYVMSPLFLLFSGWLSNPMLSLYITPLLLLVLWEYIHLPRLRYAFILGLCFGLLIQSDFAYGIFLLTLPLYWYYYRFAVRAKQIVSFVVGLLVAVISFIAVEFRFHGKTLQSIFIFVHNNLSSSHAAVDSLITLIDRIIDLIYFTLLPIPKLAILLIIIIILYRYKSTIKKHFYGVVFLLIWLTNILFFVFFQAGILGSAFIFGPSLLPAIIIGAYLLVTSFQQRNRLIYAVLVILLLQIIKLFQWYTSDYSPLSIQRGISYLQETKLIDYTYKAANEKPFTITTVTNPLYINTTWAYLYEFYGKEHYGYLPYYQGRSQIGYLGNLPEKQFATEIYYLIFEPIEGIPDIYITKQQYQEDTFSDVVDERHFGKLTVQKRLFHPDKPAIATPDALLRSPNILYE